VGRFWISAIVALLLCSSVGSAIARVIGPAVERQDIAITLEPERHALTGKSTIIFAPGARAVSLWLSETAKIDAVSIAEKAVAFSFARGIVSFELPGAATALPVTITYRAAFNDPVSQHPAAAEDPSYGVNGTITSDGTFLGDGAHWYPVPAEVPAHRSISIAAPAGIEAVTAGRRVSRKTSGAVTRSTWEEARPVGTLSLCAGPYQIQERRVGDIELYTYFYPDNASLSQKYLDAAAKYITFYSDLFGPYPFDKFAVVENFFPTGYGFPSFTLLGGSIIRLPFIIDTSFPHEIAHSWWGNGIGVDQREGNWCEGLVSYLADYLLKERRSPAEGREYRRQLLIDYASLVTPANDFPLNEFVSRNDPASRAIGYGKGAMVFHMVRTMIGDRAFFAALRQVCREHMYRSASWSDLARAFSKSAGRDLTPFMHQWLTHPGGPRLSFSEVKSRHDDKGWTISGNILQTPPFFEVAVPLRLDSAGASVREVVSVAGGRTPFTLTSKDTPSRLLLDPEVDLFRVLRPGEIPATVNSIKGSTRLIGVITDNCRAKGKTFQNLMASLSQGGAPVISEDELKKEEVGNLDLIFCGVPQDRSLLPHFPEGIEAADTSFSVEGTEFSAPDGLLVLVMQRPDSSGRVTALFDPLSDTAALQYAPKVTHYGKYGYLVFTRGANQRKGTNSAPDGGVAVQFRP
jgi:aminopeptidase N